MLNIANARRAGAFFVVAGVVLAWVGDHYAFGGGLTATVAVWLIAFGATELVVAHRKHAWRRATLLAFVLTLAFVAVALVREITEPPPGYAGNCAVLIDAVASAGVVPVSIVEPPAEQSRAQQHRMEFCFASSTKLMFGVWPISRNSKQFSTLYSEHAPQNAPPQFMSDFGRRRIGGNVGRRVLQRRAAGVLNS